MHQWRNRNAIAVLVRPRFKRRAIVLFGKRELLGGHLLLRWIFLIKRPQRMLLMYYIYHLLVQVTLR